MKFGNNSRKKKGGEVRKERSLCDAKDVPNENKMKTKSGSVRMLLVVDLFPIRSRSFFLSAKKTLEEKQKLEVVVRVEVDCRL